MKYYVTHCKLADTVISALPHIYLTYEDITTVKKYIRPLLYSDNDIHLLQDEEVIECILTGLCNYIALSDGERNLVQSTRQQYEIYDAQYLSLRILHTFEREHTLYVSNYYNDDNATEMLTVHESFVTQHLHALHNITQYEAYIYCQLFLEQKHIKTLLFLYGLGIQI